MDAAKEAVPAHHDMGGVKRFYCDSIDTGRHALTDFDREVDALRQVLAIKGLLTVDELRRGIESLAEDEYHSLTYYQRWIRSIAGVLVRRGVIGADELAARMAEPSP